ncbi:MAG TPA: FAD-dependent oxidoreductase [Thermomicrobiales bacterium]|jgi:protoporphyrinogen oxidase|nr:FAD-dependent oxidoreductase [Thermomicrobiales bacterium]
MQNGHENGNGRTADHDGATGTAANPGTGPKTVVMGAGPGGLCSAYVLSKAGIPVTVVERAPFVGGLARTIHKDTEYGQFKFDIGGHRWFTKNEELNDLFKEVVAEELLWVNRISRIYFDGHFIDYPLKVGNALKEMGPFFAARAMADYGITQVKNKISPVTINSMKDGYVLQYGPTLYKQFFQNYSTKVWGVDPGEMSADWVTQRTKGMSIMTAVKDALIPSKGKVVSLIDEFMYPRDGFGRFSDRMADKITEWGNEIRLNTGVEKVHREGNRITHMTVSTENGTQTIEADQFISSIPLTLLAQIIDPVAPPDVIEASKSLSYRNVITVNLMIKKKQVTHDTWLYVHDKNILFGRWHEPKNWSPAMVPSDDFTSLVVEYFCSFGDHIWGMTEEELVERTIKHLHEDIKFVKPEEVIGGFTIRAPRAYPSYLSGYEEHVGKVKDFIKQFENLQIIGRYGTFRYNNTDHSIETGLLAAKNILGERHDLDQVNADKEYHEIKRVTPPTPASIG